MNLYPSILTDSLAEFSQQLALVREQQEIEVVQVDIVDGYFADNLTLSPLDLTLHEYGDLKIDIHLLVEEPLDFVHELIAVADYLPIRTVIAQVERMSHQDHFVQEVRAHQWQVGLSLDVHTPTAAIDDDNWSELSVVQLMTIEAGFQGQEFQKSALKKIPDIKRQAPEAEIIVDGGVKLDLLPALKKAGVDSVVVGSGLWDATQTLATYREAAA